MRMLLLYKERRRISLRSDVTAHRPRCTLQDHHAIASVYLPAPLTSSTILRPLF
jgi:hypothetical protein